MKRVALCFAGQMRNVNKTFNQYTKPNLLEFNSKRYAIDVFVHTWFSKYDIGYSYKGSHPFSVSPPVDEDVILSVYKSYNPIRFLSEEQLHFDTKDYRSRIIPPGTLNPQFSLSRLYSVYQAIRLKTEYEAQQNFTYDIVISTRFDLGFRNPLDLDVVDEVGIWHCNDADCISVPFVMGDSKTMSLYSGLFFEIDRLFQTGMYYCDEIFAFEFLKENNVQIHTLRPNTQIDPSIIVRD